MPSTWSTDVTVAETALPPASVTDPGSDGDSRMQIESGPQLQVQVSLPLMVFESASCRSENVAEPEPSLFTVIERTLPEIWLNWSVLPW